MTKEEMKNLGQGDIVRGRMSSNAFVVMSNYGERVTAVRMVDITNPDEWELIAKARLEFAHGG